MLSSGYGIFDLALYSLGKEMVEGIIKKEITRRSFPCWIDGLLISKR